jgi:hypothetical protein
VAPQEATRARPVRNLSLVATCPILTPPNLYSLSIAFAPPATGGKANLEQILAMLERGIPEYNIPPYFDFGYQLYFASQELDDALKNVRTLSALFGWLLTITVTAGDL